MCGTDLKYQQYNILIIIYFIFIIIPNNKNCLHLKKIIISKYNFHVSRFFTYLSIKNVMKYLILPITVSGYKMQEIIVFKVLVSKLLPYPERPLNN